MKHLLALCLCSWVFLSTMEVKAQEVAKARPAKAARQSKAMKAGNKETANLSMQGAYVMKLQMLNDGTKDSVLKKEQMKIYTDRYMMYAGPRATDSLADFGIGTYQVENGKVVEHVFYTAAGGNHNDTFQVDIDQKGNGYRQVIQFPIENGIKYVLTEDYNRIGQVATSPLDGAWKQIKRTEVSSEGKMEANNSPTQFKVYQSGQFIWASTYQDSATSKPVSVFGYGTFKMDGDNQFTEINSNSTYRSFLIGRPMKVKFEMMGKDAFKQIIEGEDGSKSIEEYKRMQ